METERRKFLGGLAASLVLPGAASRAQPAAGRAIDVVRAFGFVPDGRADNYDAFHRWAAHVNRVRGGNYLFPPGTYYVHRFRTPGRGGRNTVTNSSLVGCDGLTISGHGARVLLNGQFHRSPGRGMDHAIFMPFEFAWCRNVRIAGFEVDGGVRGMTRDPSAAEVYAHLIALGGCSNVELEDLHLHHSQTDGVYLYQAGWEPRRRRGVASRNVILRRVRCTNNARGGLAPLQVNGLLCVDSSFSDNGAGLGRYVAHAPGFGVDVEPDYYAASDVDVRTGNLEFRNCRFDGNVSAFLAAYSRRYAGYLRLIDCVSSNAHGHPHHMIICWPGALVEGGEHDLGTGAFYPSWQGERGGDVTIRNCVIRTAGLYGLLHAEHGNLVRLDGVRLTGTHRVPGSHGWALAVQADPGGGRRNSVRNCDIFIPARRKSPAHAYDYEVSFHHIISEQNMFRTDLPASGGQHFCVEYGRATVARNDRYQGTSAGPRDSFRPGHMSGHDTRLPFSTG